jgi:hypothetical protein
MPNESKLECDVICPYCNLLYLGLVICTCDCNLVAPETRQKQLQLLETRTRNLRRGAIVSHPTVSGTSLRTFVLTHCTVDSCPTHPHRKSHLDSNWVAVRDIRMF